MSAGWVLGCLWLALGIAGHIAIIRRHQLSPTSLDVAYAWCMIPHALFLGPLYWVIAELAHEDIRRMTASIEAEENAPSADRVHQRRSTEPAIRFDPSAWTGR
jgi:hypothetical protein